MERVLPAMIVTLCAAISALAQAERACVTVVRCAAARVVDGIIGEEEWRRAASVTGFVKMGAAELAEPNTAASVTFDERAMYIVAECEETDPTRPRGFEREHDDRAFEDDCVRVYIAPEDLRGAKEASVAFGGYEGAYDTWFRDISAYYEFTVNCRGSMTESRNDVRDWNAPWEAKVGKAERGWVVEMAIPFASLGVSRPPESALWGFNVFRVRPPELSGWVCPHFGGYRPTPLGAVHLVSAGPVVRQAAVPPPQLGPNELTFALWNPMARDRQVEVVVEGSGAEPARREARLSPAERATIRAPYEIRFALHITPTKPVPRRKNRIYHGAYYGMEEARAAARLAIPARGNIDLRQGTLECWLKPTFDPSEPHVEPLSSYIRQFLTLITSEQEVLILYYNPDDRSMRAVTKKADGTYPVVLSGPVRMPTDEWCYVGLSWGDELRLNVNGVVATHPLEGTVAGSVEQATINLDLSHFHLDELRISKVTRPLEGVPSGELSDDADTLLLHRCDALGRPEKRADSSVPVTAPDCALVKGRFGRAIGSSGELFMDRLAHEGKRIVIFHERWSRYQGVPDLEQIPKLKKIADACHERGMLLLVYFGGLMSDASPEWLGRGNDFMALPDRMWYHRDDVEQDCYVSCVNGIWGDFLLDGIARLADEAGIDGVYMDGTTVPWGCSNPTHPGCGEDQGDGTYRGHIPLRATRRFMKRLRSIFARRRPEFFLDAHTGGAINIATQSFCDGYWDGEQLARYKPGFRLSPDTFLTGYMGRQFGFRGELLPNRHTMDQALAISLVHDTATRGQPATVDLAWADYEDERTRFIPYWERSDLYAVSPEEVLGSLYLRPDRALLVLGSQTEERVRCEVDIAGLLEQLPATVEARDAITGEPMRMSRARLRFRLSGRQWRMIELKRP